MKKRTIDPIKQAIADTAFRPFRDGSELLGPAIANSNGYRVFGDDNGLTLQIRVDAAGRGPRYFTIKVTESLT